MPTYTYKCTVCGHRFECVAKMSDPNPVCPKVQPVGTELWTGRAPLVAKQCGSPTEKVITAGAAVHFAGGGWAADGYSKRGKA